MSEGAVQRAEPRSHIAILLEVLVAATILVTTFLYSSGFSDNFLVKSAVGIGLSLWLLLLWWIRQGAAPVWVPVRLYVPFLLFLLQALISACLARNSLRAMEVWFSYLSWIAIFLVGVYLAGDTARLKRVLRVLLSCSIGISLLAVFQYFGMDLIGLPARYQALPVATLGNTNFVAHYVELMLPLAAALLLHRATTGLDRWLSAVAFVSCVILLFVIDSFGGWVSVWGGLLVGGACFVYEPRKWMRRAAIVILCLGLLSPVTEVFLGSIPAGDGTRTAKDAVWSLAHDARSKVIQALDQPDYSTAMRLLIWRDGWRLARAQGWFGVGPGNWGTQLPAYRTSVSHRDWRALIYARENQAYHAHQEFIEEYGETGLVGALLLVLLLSTAGVTCWRLTRGEGAAQHIEQPLRRAMGLAALGAVTAACIHAQFSFNLRDPVAAMHLWLIIGLAVGAGLPGQSYTISRVKRTFVTVALSGLAALATWITLSTLMSDAHFARGLNYVYARQGNRAILAFREALSWRDYDFHVSHWLGKVSLEMGRPHEALDPLQHSLRLHPHNAAALRLLARAAIETGRSETAVDAARRAVALDPLTADNYQLLALGHRSAGSSADAIGAWRQALSFHPDDVELLAALATDLNEAGQTEDAAKVLERALRAEPLNGLLHGNLGAYYLALRRLPEADAQLRRAIQLDDVNEASWRSNLIQSLMLQEQWTQALQEAQIGTRNHPADERLRRLLRTLEDRQEIR